MTQAIQHSAHMVRSINTTRAEHQHHMCGVTTHQLKIGRMSRYGHYKECYQTLIANQHEKCSPVNTNKT